MINTRKISFIALFLFICLKCEASEDIKIINIHKVLSIEDEQTCKKYSFLVKENSNKYRNLTYCLSGGIVGLSQDMPAIWLINQKTSSILDQFYIRLFVRGKTGQEVIEVDTYKYPFNYSDYLGFIITPRYDKDGNLFCIVNAKGLIPVRVFKRDFQQMDVNTMATNRKILIHNIMNLQEQCKN